MQCFGRSDPHCLLEDFTVLLLVRRKNTSGRRRRGLFRDPAAGAFDKSPNIYIANLRRIPPCAKSWPKYGDLEVSALLQTAAVVPFSG
jgi:hypothetical protein